MPNDELPITQATKVAALLDRYPQLEDVLIGFAPPFKKLKNPILRKSVAKVASLRQAAAAARVPVNELVNTLREAVGQEAIAGETDDPADSYFSEQPDWFDRAKVVASIDERTESDERQMTLVRVLQEIAKLGPGEIAELTTGFVPAPGIDVMRDKGLRVWCMEESSDLIRTFVSKA